VQRPWIADVQATAVGCSRPPTAPLRGLVQAVPLRHGRWLRPWQEQLCAPEFRYLEIQAGLPTELPTKEDLDDPLEVLSKAAPR